MSIDTFLLSSDTTDLNYPEVRPTLDLNFARVKALDPRITFTRASGGSYYGADGLIKYAGVNEARFDHDPYTGESLGFLVEESRTNNHYTSYSSSPSIYTPDGLLSSNYTTQNFTDSGYTGRRNRIQFNQVLSPGNTYTFSMYIRYYGSPNLGPKLNIGDYTGNSFDYTSVMIQYSAYAGEDFNIIETLRVIEVLQNDWYRVAITFNGPITSSSTTVPYVYMGGFSSLTELPNFGIQMWQPQLEVGGFPTSHIPPSTTRAADFASITGKNFSDFYRQDEGTFIGEWFTNGSVNTDPFLLEASDSGRNVILYITRGSGNGRVGQSGATVGGDFDFQNLGVLANNQKAKLGLAYKKNDAAGIMNGGTVSTDNQTGTITPDRLGIGNLGNVSSNYQPNGCIKRITYYPKRLPDAQLITLTR